MSPPADSKPAAFVYLQRALPRRLITRIIYRLTRIRSRFIKDASIRWFVRAFDVDVTDAARSVPADYESFNAFFTRALKPDARHIDADPGVVVCPCDGTVSELGRIDENRLLQAKGLWYTLEELLSGNEVLARCFANGNYVTVYLAPYNYHRVHMPLRARVVSDCHTGGDLYSVNQLTASTIDGLFVKNERVIVELDTPAGPMALIFVGALNVGSITTVWGGEHQAGRPTGHWAQRDYALDKGDLAGWFNMGSTVIVLAGPDALTWIAGVVPGAEVRMGQALARLTDAPL